MLGIYVTSVRVCELQMAMYDELSASNATGSFQNKCSVASQIDHSPDEVSSIVEQEWQDQSESAM